MKKASSILFAVLIVLSGMHLSIAAHYCGGELSAVKWSFSSKIATCGMETSVNDCASHGIISSNCCHNKVSVYSVDKNYNPSTLQINTYTEKLLQIFEVPASLSFQSLSLTNQLSANVSPPGQYLTSAVSLADICTFRIWDFTFFNWFSRRVTSTRLLMSYYFLKLQLIIILILVPWKH